MDSKERLVWASIWRRLTPHNRRVMLWTASFFVLRYRSKQLFKAILGGVL